MKAYQKPVLYYERFELSQHIASCDLKLNHQMGSCTASGNFWGLPINNGFSGISGNVELAAPCGQLALEDQFAAADGNGIGNCLIIEVGGRGHAKV